MKRNCTKLKKALLILTITIVVAVVLIIALISPIAKYLIEKYSEKYTGRRITMSWIYVNPFTGYVHISSLKIFESGKQQTLIPRDSIFFSANGISANFSMLKLASKTIEISEATLDHPRGSIIQDQKGVNFSDLIKLFTPKKTVQLKPGQKKTSAFRFSILYIKIINGTFYYHEKVTPIDYFIKEVNIESSGKRWDSDTMSIKFSIRSGPDTGTARGFITINFKTMDYRLATVIQKFDLKILEQYMKDLINYGNFRANLDADIKATGNLKDQENLNAKGWVVINDFHFGKTPEDDYAACEKMSIKIDTLSPKKHQYIFDSISFNHPYFKYERYDYLDNVEMVFGKNGANISAAKADPAKFNLILKISDYVKVLARNFFQSDYKINRLAIYRGNFRFNDYAISEKFSAEAASLFFLADSIDRNHPRVQATLKSGIKPYGEVSVSLSINPKDKEDFDIRYYLQGLPAALFNPYIVTYTSYPLDRGTLEFTGTWNVRNGIIRSVNHLVIIDPRTTKRIRNKDTKWIPVPLIMALIRERGNVIDYEIPITGDLKDPKFHLHDVLMDLLSNIFVKPATTPYRLEVKNMESEIEKSLNLKWQMRQSKLLPNQEKFLVTMAEFLKKNPDASIAVYPMEYTEREKEHILFFEAKKKYFLIHSKNQDHAFTEDDSVTIDKMSIRDSLFSRYLTKQAHNNLMFTIQEKCSSYVGSTLVDAKFTRLHNDRERGFFLYFRKNAVEKRVIMHPSESTIPYNGASFYKISYKGELPEKLAKAYRKMNELNNESPRNKFKKDRKKAKAGP